MAANAPNAGRSETKSTTGARTARSVRSAGKRDKEHTIGMAANAPSVGRIVMTGLMTAKNAQSVERPDKMSININGTAANASFAGKPVTKIMIGVQTVKSARTVVRPDRTATNGKAASVLTAVKPKMKDMNGMGVNPLDTDCAPRSGRSRCHR